MSNVRMRSKPACDATNDAPLTPPAGPDSTVCTGLLHADSRLIRPPSDRTTWIGARTCAAASPSRTFVRYRSSVGATYAFMSVVTVRSYSRNSGRISDEIDTGRSGATEAAISPTTRSWRPFACALSRQTVSASTPSATSSSTAARTAAASIGSTIAPSAPVRSGTSRTYRVSVSGSGFSYTMNPNNGPGVHASARWRICRKPLVTIRPTSAPRRSRTAFVATVVPWRIASRSGKGRSRGPPPAGCPRSRRRTGRRACSASSPARRAGRRCRRGRRR